MIIRFVDSSVLGLEANGDYAINTSDSSVYENIDGLWDDSNANSIYSTNFTGCIDVDLQQIKFNIVENTLPIRDNQGDIITRMCNVDLYIQAEVHLPGDEFSYLFGVNAKVTDSEYFTNPAMTYVIDKNGNKQDVTVDIPTFDRVGVILPLLDELVKQFNIQYNEQLYRKGIASIKHADLPFPTIYNDYQG